MNMKEKRIAKREIRFRLDDDLIEKIAEISKRNGLPIAAQVRMYIIRGLEREGLIQVEERGGQEIASKE